MRLIATGLLVVMAGLFILARHMVPASGHWGYLRAFAEAAMVGGLADWFAVTALFRRPLGLPIPHTAIIPENKDRIADTMAAFLQANFLTPQVVARRLQSLDAAATLGTFLANPRGSEGRLREGATTLLGDILESLDPDKLGGMAKGALRTQIERLELAPLLGQMLGAVIADGRHMPVIESAIRRAALAIEANEDLIRTMIHDRANAVLRWTGLDERLANSVLEGLYKIMAETVVVQDHPLRRKIEEGLSDLAHDLVHDPAMRERVERMKREMLDNPAFATWLDGLWERARARMLAAVRNPQGVLAGQIGTSLADLGRALQQDDRLKLQVNRFARRTLVGVSSRYGGQIVRLVSETVRRWDARTVTDRIEGAVGRDLQFIRINGTLVGGLVGVAIHAVDMAL
ncbi:DUF445 domain-containing protein [Novosphingobium cyanobacteriorum]|uniref:DUF445 domain-containing protein n=1 Tax=Novosphingobium cyanobacteriorum TaxID=3024215 RepID=A0ABT6CG59_9SPHN|nr:DUF445 domain-containing protein [Novosphingobium cyanobacteriorum]MDF8332906.1 DUF445 domain-containing protein [Novosphingobium cyanobacteriorum]